MKSIAKSVAAALLVASMCGNALADPGRHGRPPPAYHQHQRDSGDDFNWIGPLIVLGIAAAVLSSTAEPAEPARPAYGGLPPPPAPLPQAALPQAAPAAMWHFCRSAGQYYPYVQSWELLSPVPPQVQ